MLKPSSKAWFRIGITIGDVTWIGPEVTVLALEALESSDQVRASWQENLGLHWVLLGDRGWLERVPRFRSLEKQLGSRLEVDSGGLESLPETLDPGAGPAARAAVRWLERGARLCLDGELDAFVTAPVNKLAIQQAGIPFTGQTEFLAKIAGVTDPVMMLLGTDEKGRWLRVALVTTHLPLRTVPDQISIESVVRTCRCAAEACRLLGISTPRIGVAGLNPHAGEQGAFGKEEIQIIAPAVQQVRSEGISIEGPLSGDVIFHHALTGRFDAVVAMYHDQGLAPLKTVAFDRGVNWTLGLPFIRTSPDHGTAYDLAGKGQASPHSMIEAIRLALHLAQAKRAGHWPWSLSRQPESL